MKSLNNTTILAIDKNQQVLQSFKELLADRCAELLLESDAVLGLALATEKQPDLILLDITVDKMDGYEICERLKKNKRTAKIPVIFFSSLLRSADKVKSFEVGGAGYISIPRISRRSSDAEKESKKVQRDDTIAKIEACLLPRSKNQPLFENQALNIEELLRQYQFKSREVEILRLYISGYKRSELATQLYISENTVKWHLKNIFQKLGVKTRATLIEKVRGANLTTSAQSATRQDTADE